MTLQERAEKLAMAILLIADSKDDECKDLDKAKLFATLALKEQDKTTRHACAEAVAGVKQTTTVNSDGEVVFKIAQDVRDEAHSAVINCRGGVE